MTSNQDRDPRIYFPTPEAEIIDPTSEAAEDILNNGEFIGGHTMPWGSNYTFMIWLSTEEGKCIRAIYKPRDGERPLHDFPNGTLYQRERATYILSKELGWPNVPLTIIRNGPYGIGSVQLYVDCDPRITYFEMRDSLEDKLAPIATFDLLTNNADRKAGHCLLDKNKTIWSIDHGLTFHPTFKLRTVMLEYCGQKINSDLLKGIGTVKNLLHDKGNLYEELLSLTSIIEIEALANRLDTIINNPTIPILDPNRDVPWPFV